MAGKSDTRQKMINMMYLVFIAMLALNISKEVLATLGILNDDLESSIVELESSSKINYDQINSNSDELDYKIAAEMVGDMRTVSDDFYNFIQVVKDSLINSDENKYLKEVSVKSNRDSIITMTDYQIMDKSQILDEYLFNGDLYTENGDLFLEKFINYPLSINNILDQITQKENSSEKETKINFDFNSIKDDLSNRFKYSEKIVTSEGTELSFLNYNFEGFPMIASISKLTKIQSDIRYIENKVLTQILNAVQNKGLNFNTFQTLLETTKPVYYTTDVIDAAVVMGKKDEGFRPDKVELFFNEKPLRASEFKIESGKVVLNKKITSPGTYDLTGTITKRNADTQELVSIPVNQSIVVIKEPNSAVVSADNMKVFYRGLRNPSSISIPGVAESSIRPSSNNGEFIKLSNGGWGAVPTSDFSKKTMKVSVSGVLNGKRKQFDGGEFRILEPPPGLGSIKVNDNYYKPTENIPKRYLSNGMITGNKPKDFLYDFIIEVTSFDIKVGNSPSKTVKGNSARNNPKAVADINSQGRGTVVRISNIKASAKDGDFVNPNYIVNDFIVILE
jgi:gliding motility-associated protein GldM